MNHFTPAYLFSVVFAAAALAQPASPASLPAGHGDAPKNRVIVLADMGNEPDEEQQNVHLLVCANEFDIEGLIAVTGKYLRTTPQPELYRKLVDAYAKVLPNLKKHAPGWPEADYLHSVTCAGQSGYGIADTGPGKSSPGSKLIEAALKKDDPRLLYIVGNAGTNTLAQALLDLRSSVSPGQFATCLNKIRVFENGSQDNAGAWICHEFPEIFWIRSNYQTYAWGGPSGDGNNQPGGKGLGPHTWQPYAYSWEGQRAWWREHIQQNHGALGALYPDRLIGGTSLFFIEGGGTAPWLGLTARGIGDIDQPSWGGFSGRFTAEKVTNFWSRHSDIRPDEEKNAPFRTFREVSDSWTDPETGLRYDNDYAPIWRWRRATFNDLAARMDWCVVPFRNANHHPVAAVNGSRAKAITRLQARPGDAVKLDASASTDRDPDDRQLYFRWFTYPEAGTYAGDVLIVDADRAVATVNIPTGAGGKQIHVILEVSDRENGRGPRLFDYRRIVFAVEAFP